MATTQSEIKARFPLSTLARKRAPSSQISHSFPASKALRLSFFLLLGVASLFLVPSSAEDAPVAASREGLSSDSVLIQTKATVLSERVSMSFTETSPLAGSVAKGYASLTWSMILFQLAMGALLAKCCQAWLGPGQGSASAAKAKTRTSSPAAAPCSPTLLERKTPTTTTSSSELASKGHRLGASSSGPPPPSFLPAPTDDPDRKASLSSLPSASPTMSPSSSLLEAAHQDDLARARSLLARGARGDSADAWGCTALHVAAGRGNLEMVRLLLRADPALVHCREAWDETPLHAAARSGQVEALDTLCSKGANLDALNADDKTPLVLAAEAGHKGAAELLLDRGAGAGEMEDKDLPALLTVLLVQRAIECCGAPSGPMPDAEGSESSSPSSSLEP